ncbi:transcriptional attenuator, LytR family [Quadrisphaera granulorum]|uniref:LytR family transcriptional attenuator n=1 Tax=Quadrisphaera granulorum TaxID=317664 RepID=A0A315ZR76_9ACTN|nr:LCP family protein [Quadrisphaera granulorum]PWJ47490.1 LytR family transcriptional attenuator [Quadrisphaera granulorum]SZE98791.1 transcriptional attenuator, LytR family [Quadrisphaera granulorum]
MPSRVTPAAPEGPGAPAGSGVHPSRARMLRRRRRTLRLLAAGAVVVLLGGAAAAYGVYRHLDANITSADISKQLGADRPTEMAKGAENILVLGSDSRAGTGTEYGAGLTTSQSDTMLLVHLSADRTWASAVSIPRDSWVSIPSCTGSDGTVTTPRHAKINEAFTLGSEHGGVASGAACSIKTVEEATGVRIDHFVVVDFEGFKDMTTALGGVPVCTTAPVVDPKANLDLPAGQHTLEGEQALAFVRERHAIGDGSDLGRINRQQQFLASMARTAESELTDPTAMYGFLNAATKSITTDSGLGSLSALASLAESVKSLPPSQLQFFTVPNHPRSDVVKSDTANVLWSEPAANALFTDLQHDVDPTSATPATTQAPSPSASSSASSSPKPSASTPAAPLTPSVTGADQACTVT